MPPWLRPIAFRDYLRAHSDAAAEYEILGMTAFIVRVPEAEPLVHADVIPHLTVADQTTDGAAVAEAELASILQRVGAVRAQCREIELIENSTGRWKAMHVIPLPD